jgi:hypothetical protein
VEETTDLWQVTDKLYYREKDYVKDTESDKKTEASKSDLLEPNPERDSDEGGSTIPLLQLVQQLLRYLFYYPLNLTDKVYYIMLYQVHLVMRFKLTTSVMIGIVCNYHTIMKLPMQSVLKL